MGDGVLTEHTLRVDHAREVSAAQIGVVQYEITPPIHAASGSRVVCDVIRGIARHYPPGSLTYYTHELVEEEHMAAADGAPATLRYAARIDLAANSYVGLTIDIPDLEKLTALDAAFVERIIAAHMRLAGLPDADAEPDPAPES